MRITDEAVEAFKAAWHQADAEGDEGNRVLRGLTAAGPHIAAEVRRAPDGCAWCCASNPPGVKPGSGHEICPTQRDRIDRGEGS